MAISTAAQTALDRLTQSWGQPLTITSGYRDPAYNASVGGARNSQHTHGNAFDIDVSKLSPQDRLALADAARAAGFQGFGFYDNSLHFDVGAPRAWGPSYSRDSIPAWAADWVGQNIGGAGRAGGGNVTMSTSGGGSMGLLDMQDQAPRTFGQRLKQGLQSGSLMDAVALAANSLRMQPDQGIAQLIGQRQQQRQDAQIANRTAQWLATKGRTDLAEALMTGAIDPKSAVAAALEPPKAQGSVLDAATLRQMFPGAEIAEGLYSMQPDGTVSKVGGNAPSVNIDMGGGKFEEAFAKSDAAAIEAAQAAGSVAQRNLARLGQLENLLKTAPTGGVGALKLAAGQFGINTEGLNEIQAAQALISSLVPEQRPPGSGTMSDADLALFKQSLPSIINQPGGNALILQTLKGVAQYDLEGLNITQQLRDGTIDRPTAFKMLMERRNPLEGFTAPQTTGTTTAVPDTLTPDDLQYLGMGN